MKRNQLTLELIHTKIREDELCHMTPEEKKAYNAQYYQRNKEKYWGVNGSRPVGRQKYVTEGNGQGVQRRGEGLTGYSAITNPNGYHKRAGSVNYHRSTPASFATDEYMDNSLNGYAYLKDGDVRKPVYTKYKSLRHDAIVYQRLAQESSNKANDYRRMANEILKQNKSPEDNKRNKYKYDAYMEKAAEEDRKAKSWQEQQKTAEKGMENCVHEMKRLASEIEAHNQTFTPNPSNKPHGPSVNSEAFSSAYKKAERKQKVKKAASQASSDWKSGSKTVKQLASDSVAKGKSIASSIFSKFKK